MRADKFFQLEVDGGEEAVSIDGLKEQCHEICCLWIFS
jgi:hypothetical protein